MQITPTQGKRQAEKGMFGCTPSSITWYLHDPWCVFLTLELVAFTIDGVSITAGTSIVARDAPGSATLAIYEVVGITASAITPDTSFIALGPAVQSASLPKLLALNVEAMPTEVNFTDYKLCLCFFSRYTHFICL